MKSSEKHRACDSSFQIRVAFKGQTVKSFTTASEGAHEESYHGPFPYFPQESLLSELENNLLHSNMNNRKVIHLSFW